MFNKSFLIEDTNYKKYIIYKSIAKKIAKEKSKIDLYKKIWDIIKKISNPYELIYINSINSISVHIPISRSFFKMWEILHEFNILKKDNVNTVACLAEGPGGFIEAIDKYGKNYIYGITLKPTNNGIPNWKNVKSFKENVKVLYGDLNETDDVLRFQSYINKKVDLVTADGGIDYSSDYNKQEQMSYEIIFSEIITSLLLLNKGGSFVCKIFDTFSIMTIKLLYIVKHYFKDFELYKPKTSRILNSEKYIIARNFTGITSDEINIFLKFHKEMNENVVDIQLKLPKPFIYEIDEYINIFSENQYLNLSKSIKLAESKKYRKDYNLEEQINNAINWCKKYKIKINKRSKFISSYPLHQSLV